MKTTIAQKFYSAMTLDVRKARAQAHTQCSRINVDGNVEVYTFDDSSKLFFDADEYAFYLGYR